MIFVTRVTRRVPHVEQEVPSRPEHLSSPPVFNGVQVARSLVFCVMFCTSLFFLLSFFLWPLYFLSFDFRFLITPLVLQTFPIFIQNELKVFSAIIYKMSAMLWCSVSMVKEIADQEESDKLLINVVTKYSSMYERRSHTQLAPGSARITSNDVLNTNVLLCHVFTCDIAIDRINSNQ